MGPHALECHDCKKPIGPQKSEEYGDQFIPYYTMATTDIDYDVCDDCITDHYPDDFVEKRS